MTHVESIEPRTHFTNTGLDAHFGTHGVAALPVGLTAQHFLSTKSAVFVDVTSVVGQRRYVFKYTSRGRIDSAWGDNGHVRVLPPTTTLDTGPLSPKLPSRAPLAYDESTQSLYVAGTDADHAGTSVAVERFTSAGALDKAFGDGGATSVAVPAPADPNADLLLTFDAIGLAAGGQILVAFSRRSDTDSYGLDIKTASTTTLWRLKPDGDADTAFGDTGQVTVASGTGTLSVSDHSDYGRVTQPVFADWTINPDGSVRVIDLRENSRYADVYGAIERYDTQTLSSTQYVESNVVSSAGIVRSGPAERWTLSHDAFKNAHPNRQTVFRPVMVAVDGQDGVAVIGARAIVATGFAGSLLAAIRLSPAGRSTPTSLDVPDGGAFTGVARDPDGSGVTYVLTGERVTRLRSDLSVFASFGTHGRLLVDGGLAAPAVDLNGELLAFGDDNLLRFDGKQR